MNHRSPSQLSDRLNHRPSYQPPVKTLAAVLGIAGLTVGSITFVLAGERRAIPPQFGKDAFSDTFFRSPDQAIRGQRPPIGAAGGPASPAPRSPAGSAPSHASSAVAGSASGAPSGGTSTDNSSSFAGLVSPQTLEDEIKRVRLQYDAAVTTPAAFRSGAFQDARVHLSTLAALFAIVQEHPGEVRWRKDAAAARDLLARTAANCSAGTPQVYNEARMRKDDLEDILSGSGLSTRQASEESDWSLIIDRVPLMTYADHLLEQHLKPDSRDDATVTAQIDELRRSAEMMAVVGQILMTEGLVDADDADYRELCQELITASRQVAQAIEQSDAAAVRQGIGAISQSCQKCHENYR